MIFILIVNGAASATVLDLGVEIGVNVFIFLIKRTDARCTVSFLIVWWIYMYRINHGLLLL